MEKLVNHFFLKAYKLELSGSFQQQQENGNEFRFIAYFLAIA